MPLTLDARQLPGEDVPEPEGEVLAGGAVFEELRRDQRHLVQVIKSLDIVRGDFGLLAEIMVHTVQSIMPFELVLYRSVAHPVRFGLWDPI